ncbi:MAG: LysR family transcriptional regulator [Polyangiaceae bacterium]
MAPIDLNHLRALVAVRETGSFSAAAQRLGVPRSTVSRAVSALEASLEVPLFQRTTRRVAITAAAALFDRVAPALAGIEAAVDDLPDRSEEPSGTLRVTSTADLGVAVLAEAVTRYTARYPRTTVEVHAGSALLNLVREGVDLALRVHPRARPDSSLVARRVGTIALQLYAAPAYLARRGAPRSPEEVANHDWLAFRGAPAVTLPGSAGKLPLLLRSRVVCNEMFVARELLRRGAGVGALPSFVADQDVAEGTLVRLLPRWTIYTSPVMLVYPTRKHLPSKVRAFRDLLLEMLRAQPLSPPPGR